MGEQRGEVNAWKKRVHANMYLEGRTHESYTGNRTGQKVVIDKGGQEGAGVRPKFWGD